MRVLKRELKAFDVSVRPVVSTNLFWLGSICLVIPTSSLSSLISSLVAAGNFCLIWFSIMFSSFVEMVGEMLLTDTTIIVSA